MVGGTATANGSSDGNLAATYALIYSFLSARSHEKAAAAVKKAVKDVIVLKDNVTVDGPSLDEIVRWWRAKEEANAKKESNSDSDSDSSSDSASSDDSSSVASRTIDSNHKTGSGTLPDKPPTKSNDSISKKSGKATKSISSPSSSDNDSSESDSNSPVAAPAKASQTAIRPPKVGTTVVLKPSDSTFVRATKKQRLSESGNAVATAIVTETSSSTPNQNGKATGKKALKSNTPFQRIKADAVEFHDERLKDNAFVARGASANDYGARANQDLIVTRGDGFRKEKNKKKRGSYRGGEITMESHSIKFT